MPLDPKAQQEVEGHCQFLTPVTKRDRIPLGMSLERGYRLCYGTGPFSEREARVPCGRLATRVKSIGAETVVCEADPANPPPPQETLDRTHEQFT